MLMWRLQHRLSSGRLWSDKKTGLTTEIGCSGGPTPCPSAARSLERNDTRHQITLYNRSDLLAQRASAAWATWAAGICRSLQRGMHRPHPHTTPPRTTGSHLYHTPHTTTSRTTRSHLYHTPQRIRLTTTGRPHTEHSH